VDDISIVEADAQLQFDPGPDGDYVTLVACTPIGINSHRLLVRGSRIATPPTEVVAAIEATAPAGTQFPTWALAWLAPTGTSSAISHLLLRRRGNNQ